MLFVGGFRIGEACHPGPDADHFVLGVANPSGLRNKAPFVSDPDGPWGYVGLQ